MTDVAKTAVVSSKAEIGANVKIADFAVIHDDVKIGDNSVIGPHAVIYNGARIGKNVKIYQGASVSNEPQDLKFSGEPTDFIIGDNTVIREFVTLHRGTEATGYSKVGSDCLLMAYTHVAHDCVIGDKVICANSVQIGGHVHIGDWAIIGGATPVHQFSQIGRHVMIGGGFRVTYDIPPFVMGVSEPLRFGGVNLLGLRRRGFSNEDIAIIKNVYSILYNSGKNLSAGKAAVKEQYGDNIYATEILEFLDKVTRPGFK